MRPTVIIKDTNFIFLLLDQPQLHFGMPSGIAVRARTDRARTVRFYPAGLLEVGLCPAFYILDWPG